MGYLRVTVGQPRVTISYLKATVVHIRVILGHLRITIGYFFSISKDMANTTELGPAPLQITLFSNLLSTPLLPFVSF